MLMLKNIKRYVHVGVILEGIYYGVNGTALLRGVSAVFEEGKAYLIMGKSGVGKTTLLKIIAGILRPTGGKVMFMGHHRVAYIPQNLGLIKGATALENVLLAFSSQCRLCPLTNMWPRSYVDRALAALRAVMLGDKAWVKVENLSGGEMQRVAIARAMAYGADVILADEPVSNLDEENAAHVVELLTGLRSRGLVISVMHNREFMDMFDEVYMLDMGSLKPLCRGTSSCS